MFLQASPHQALGCPVKPRFLCAYYLHMFCCGTCLTCWICCRHAGQSRVEYVQKHYLFLHAWKRGTHSCSLVCRSLLVSYLYVDHYLSAHSHQAIACSSMAWLCRFLPRCYTYTSVCGLGCYGSHLHHNLLLLWTAMVEHLAASLPSLVQLV